MARLKVKLLRLFAGKPIAILHRDFAEKASIHPGERVRVNKGNKNITAVVDTATKLLKDEEVVVSNEIKEKLKLRKGDKANVRLAKKPPSIHMIHKKLEGHRLEAEEINQIIEDIVQNNLTDAEIAYFISGIFNHGMSMRETADLTKAMVDTGKKLELKGKVVDKHSIGGIPGRTSPIVVSICSAAGLNMPKTSSRAITTPSGTADAMETICKVDFNFQEIKNKLNKKDSCLVWGGKLNLAPADDEIIEVERLLNLDPTPQLLASILAKKLSVNANYILINIPYGRDAKVTKKEAEQLKRKFYQLVKYFDIKVKCVLNKVREPYGNGVGPVLEIRDAIKVLKGESNCYNLKEQAVQLAGKILDIAGKSEGEKGEQKARELLESGQAWEEFKEIVKNQDGKIKDIEDGELEIAHHKKIIKADKSGKVKDINIEKINQLARAAGCPLDKKAGLYLHKHLNDKIKKGEKLLTIYAESRPELSQACEKYEKERPIEIE